MEIFLTLLAIVIGLIVDYCIAKQFAEAAEDKGYTDGKYFWMCFLTGLPGYLLVAALPDRGKTPARVSQPPVTVQYVQTPAPQPTAAPNAPQQTAPAAKGPVQVFSDGSWQCTCGRKNMRYVSTCVCGKSKH